MKLSDTSIDDKQQKVPLGGNEAPPLNTCDEISYYIDQNDITNVNDLMVAGGQLLRPGILYENMRVEFGVYYYFQAFKAFCMQMALVCLFEMEMALT